MRTHLKPIEKIVIAGIIGTTFMTLYSYGKAKKENQQYVEPVLLNELIDNSSTLPDLNNERSHPAGWGLHYGAGILFVIAYWLIWRKALERPSLPRIIIIGSVSGVTGIMVWKTLFAHHENPPGNNRYGYYRQLFTAHIVFALSAMVSYKALNYLEKK